MFEKSFGSQGSGAGELEDPAGVAVDEATGNVYVVDEGNNRVEWFSPSGTFLGQFDGSGAFANENGTQAPEALSAPEAIAIDDSCEARRPVLTGEACEAFDPSNGDVYVTDTGHGVIDKFSPTGEYIGQAEGFTPLNGVSVDAKGELWAYQEEAVTGFPGAPSNVLSESESERRQLTAEQIILGASAPGLAVDAGDDFYARFEAHEGAEDVMRKFSAGGSLVSRAVDDEVPSGVQVELVTGDVYLDNVGAVTRFRADGSVVERLPAMQEAFQHGTGVGVDGVSETVFVADSSADRVDVFVPQLAAAPTVEGESVSEVTPSSASLAGELNPRGQESGYRFEYGRCVAPDECGQAGYEASVPVPDGSVGGGFGVDAVGERVEGLASASTYHFRLVASNASGTVFGPSRVFSTPGAGEQVSLLDGRQWEMVSPPDKHGALLFPIGEFGVAEAALNGQAISYLSSVSAEESADGQRARAQLLSRRGSDGWSTQTISVAQEGVSGVAEGSGEQYRFFSEDLSSAVVQPFGVFASPGSVDSLSPAASEQTAFLRSLQTGEYSPLVTGCPVPGQACPAAVAEAADVPAGTVFGLPIGGQACTHGELAELHAAFCGPEFLAASPDAQAVVLRSSVALTSSSPEASEGGLYLWRAGQPSGSRLSLVSVLPRNEAGEEQPAPTGTLHVGLKGQDERGAVSSDGSRVFWEAEGRLYVRDVTRGETVELDAPEAGCPQGSGQGECEASGGGRFQFASADGSRVFFTDEHRLTRDSGASPEHEQADLYECEVGVLVEGGVERLHCALRDLTPLDGGEHAAVQGSVVGASTDGSWVYFVADGVLGGAAGAVHGACSKEHTAVFGAVCDLYVMHDGVGGWEAPRVVAALSEEDEPDWEPEAILPNQPARVSGNGLWLAFMSQRPLTGFDSEDVSSVRRGERLDEEVYVYDAATAELACASCSPAGERPAGAEFGDVEGGPSGATPVWPSRVWVSGVLPGWDGYKLLDGLYQPRFLSDGGRLFFDSVDGLVPLDTNGVMDVYEWEPAGVGSCSSGSSGGSVVFRPSRGFSSVVERGEANPVEVVGGGREPAGCVGLVSSGSSAQESGFLDASETGGDVFFLTTAQLSGADTDSAFDVYDAHECSGEAPCFAPVSVGSPACSTEASCRPAPSPQPSIFGAPASGTFAGAGNAPPPPPPVKAKAKVLTRGQLLARALAGCRRKHPRSRKKRVACERRARRAYRAKPSRKPSRKPGRKSARSGERG